MAPGDLAAGAVGVAARHRLLLALGVVTGLARPNRKKLRTNCGFGTVPVSEMFTADLHLMGIDQRGVRDRRRTPVIAFEIPSHQRIQGDAAEGRGFTPLQKESRVPRVTADPSGDSLARG